jgi:hypothetical protein
MRNIVVINASIGGGAEGLQLQHLRGDRVMTERGVPAHGRKFASVALSASWEGSVLHLPSYLECRQTSGNTDPLSLTNRISFQDAPANMLVISFPSDLAA